MKLFQIIISVLLIIQCLSVNLNQLQIGVDERETIDLGESDLSFNYLPGTKWQNARMEFFHVILSSEDYERSSRAENLISKTLRTVFLSDRLSVIIYGNEILNLNYRLIEDNQFKYSLEVGNEEGKAKLLFSFDLDETVFDEILMDIVNHRDSQ